MEGIVGGVHGSQLDAATWRAIEDLYERVWPTLPARLRVAERLGARWADHTTPFTWFERGRPIATVGVLEHPMIVAGEGIVVAGIHSVGTDPEHRGRGLCRELLHAALAWADERYACAKLSTHSPRVFAGHGFDVLPTARFVVSASADDVPGGLRRLDLNDGDDLRIVHEHLSARAPVSDRFATLDPGWLCLIDAALARVTDTWFFAAPTLDVTLVANQDDRAWIIHDVVGPRLPDIDALHGVLPGPYDRIVLTFCPDRIAPHATAEPTDPSAGVTMLRGAWPQLTAVGVPALWEH